MLRFTALAAVTKIAARSSAPRGWAVGQAIGGRRVASIGILQFSRWWWWEICRSGAFPHLQAAVPSDTTWRVSQAIYPGSFDPVTFGHLDVIERASHLFGSVIVAVATGEGKAPLFSVDERIKMLEASVGGNPAIKIVALDGLLVEFAQRLDVFTVIRGLRAVSDFEFEFQMALMNRKLEARLETVFFTPKEDYTYLSSRIVKEVARLGGDVSPFVPPPVAKKLREILSAR